MRPRVAQDVSLAPTHRAIVRRWPDQARSDCKPPVAPAPPGRRTGYLSAWPFIQQTAGF